MHDDPSDLLETVLDGLTEARGDPLVMLRTLASDCPDARATALIRACLAAEHSLRATFVHPANGPTDADLARAMAQTLAEAADRAERAGGPSPIRLRDLLD